MHLLLSRARALMLPLVLALSLVSTLTSQTVLDDFSTDLRSTSYTFKTGDDATWRVVNGLLDPLHSSSAPYSAWIWSGGQSLSQVGDAFSIDLLVAANGNAHNAGLAAWASSAANTNPATDRPFEPRLTYDSGTYTFTSEFNNGQGYLITNLSGAPSGMPTLTITLTDQTATTTTLTALLTGSGFTSISHAYTFNNTAALFVGPSSYEADGTNVAFDNLTYSTSAVPEPSTYAAIFGSAALGLAAWRRRRATGEGASAN